MTRNLFLLSPYRPPTSYPVTLTPEEASAWLNAYAALWHPAALKDAARPPQPASPYDHDTPADHAVYAVAEGPHLYQPADWADRVRDANAVSFTGTPDRAATVANLLAGLPEAGDYPEAVVAAFAGIGYGYLMLDTLCDAMSHDRLLDAEGFWTDIAAAVAASADEVAAMPHLRAAAEKLFVARDSMLTAELPVLEWHFVRDGRFPAGLSADRPGAVIVPAAVLAEWPAETLAALRSLTPAVEVCTGAFTERDDAFLPPESQIWSLVRSREVGAALFGSAPNTFARWKSAGHPAQPSWLAHAGFTQALVPTLDGAVAPTRYAAVVTWPGPDGRSIPAVTKEPLKADDPQTYFNLAYHVHHAVGHDASPTLALLHEGKPPAVGYADWLALTALAPVFGVWTNPTRYFETAPAGDYTGPSYADEFFADALDDRVTNRRRPDPVSGFARHARLRRRLDAAFTLAALHRVLTPAGADDVGTVAALIELENAVETRGEDVGPADAADELCGKLSPAEGRIATTLAARIQQRSEANRPGFLVFNPCGFNRRVAVELPGSAGAVAVGGAVKASEFEGGVGRVVVEVPGLGFAWIPRNNPAPPPARGGIVTAENAVVRNEFFEAELDPATGGLRAFRDARTRVNRLGMQLVFNPGSSTKCRGVRVTHRGAALGEVTADGDILDAHGELLATFTHRLRAWIGRPALEQRIELKPARLPDGFPWHAYFGARFGWREDRSALYRGVGGSTTATTHPRPCSPEFVEVRSGPRRSFVFTGGLPFVQKQGNRMFDVVLVPQGETATAFDLLLSMDRDHPAAVAAGWTAPAPVVPTDRGPPPGGVSGWLGHLNLPGLLLLALKPDAAGKRGVLARLMETSGFAGAAELRFARDAVAAWTADAAGTPIAPIAVQAGGVPLEFSANELFTLRVEFE